MTSAAQMLNELAAVDGDNALRRLALHSRPRLLLIDEIGYLLHPNVPDYWSAEQALAVYDFLDELRERVWDRYGEQITERKRLR